MFRSILITIKKAPPAVQTRSIGSGLKSIYNGCSGASSVLHGPGISPAIKLGGPTVSKIPPAYVAKGIIRSSVVRGPTQW